MLVRNASCCFHWLAHKQIVPVRRLIIERSPRKEKGGRTVIMHLSAFVSATLRRRAERAARRRATIFPGVQLQVRFMVRV